MPEKPTHTGSTEDRRARVLRIVIADDHPIFLHGMQSLIAKDPEMDVVAACSRGDEALEAIIRCKPDLAVLDLAMPGLDGLAIAAALRKEQHQTPVVLLSAHDDPLLVERARRLRVNAYLNKRYALNDLLGTLQQVGQGTLLLTPPEDHSGAATSTLTEREREVLRLVACGLHNRFIAETLAISIKTVDNHRSNIMKKLNVHSTAELVRYAVKLGLA